jgi:phosphoglycerate dehydrogenase-like enzyme
MAKPRVVVVKSPHSDRRHWSPAAQATLDSFADWREVVLTREMSDREREAAVDAALADADGLVLCGWGGMGIGRLSADRLARMPRLRYVGSTSHYRQAEYADMPVALGRGIAFSETAPVMSPWVAEYELALGLAAMRRLPQEHEMVGRGEWTQEFVDVDWFDRLQGRRVGLASFGEIHRHLARMLAPFECEWQAYDPFVPADRIAAAGGQKADDLVAMAGRSEILFVATPPNPSTIGLISRPVIGALPIGAVFVLVSRMAVVEQPPLIERLERGELRAGIDVFEPEPPAADHPLRRLPNVVHTPHRAGNTAGAHRGVFLAQCQDARRHFAGEPLQYPLRPELVALFQPRPAAV